MLLKYMNNLFKYWYVFLCILMKVMCLVLLYFFIFYCNNFIFVCLNKKFDGMFGKVMFIFEIFLLVMFGEGWNNFNEKWNIVRIIIDW